MFPGYRPDHQALQIIGWLNYLRRQGFDYRRYLSLLRH
jgi:hypothetical protein